MPDRYSSHPIYLQYLEESRGHAHKKNPYYEAVHEAAVRWSQKPLPANKNSTVLPLGLVGGQPAALLVSHADETSLTGDIRTGSLNAEILRYELRQGVKIQELSVASMLEIDYEKANPFTLKPIGEFKAQMEELFVREERPFDESYQQVKKMAAEVLLHHEKGFLSDRIQFQLAAIDKLLAFDPVIETPQQELTNKARVLLEVLQLQKLVGLIKDEDIMEKAHPKPPVNFRMNKALPAFVFN